MDIEQERKTINRITKKEPEKKKPKKKLNQIFIIKKKVKNKKRSGY